MERFILEFDFIWFYFWQELDLHALMLQAWPLQMLEFQCVILLPPVVLAILIAHLCLVNVFFILYLYLRILFFGSPWKASLCKVQYCNFHMSLLFLERQI